jgi:hypothetical protein
MAGGPHSTLLNEQQLSRAISRSNVWKVRDFCWLIVARPERQKSCGEQTGGFYEEKWKSCLSIPINNVDSFRRNQILLER